MELVAVLLFLIGLVAWLAYKRGGDNKHIDAVEEEVENVMARKDISDLSDAKLDDRLRKYWED